MALSARQAQYLGHVFRAVHATGRLAWETGKAAPKIVRFATRTKTGSAVLGAGVGGYVGYKTARKVQGLATNYTFGGRRFQ